jgi:two-component system response regulator QseB
MRILLVEDDPMMGKAVRKWLCKVGFSVDWTQDGRIAEVSIATEAYGLVVLDLTLPGRSGLDLLGAVRSRGNNVPVLVATARDAVADRIAGLNAGADDYIIKPYDLDELVARMRALIRRQAGSGLPVFRCGNILLDPVNKTVKLDGKGVTLSAREFSLLEVLIRRPGAVIARRNLEEALYGWGEEVVSNAIDVHMHNLRRKLGADVIKTVRGVGFRMAGKD